MRQPTVADVVTRAVVLRGMTLVSVPPVVVGAAFHPVQSSHRTRLPPAPTAPLRRTGGAGLTPAHGSVRSARSAVPALPRVGFSEPPPEPGVPVVPAPGSPQVPAGSCWSHATLGHGDGMRAPR